MAEGVVTVSTKKAEPEKQTQLYYEDGSPIAPADVAGAVTRGEAFTTGDTVRVVGAGGETGTVSRGGLANTLAQQGASVETASQGRQRELRQDAGSLSGMAKTAGEGLLRGATMGFAGPEQFYDAEGRERALARMQANPKIAGGTELAGALGSAVAASVLSGGTASGGAAARLAALGARGALTPFRAAAALGEAAEGLVGGSGVLARGAALGLRGAAEGALYGTGHEVSQAALENVPLTAERLLAGAWDGAKLGGAFGAGLGVLGAGVGKAGRAIVGRMAESGDDLTKATGSFAERTMARQHLDGARIWKKVTSDGTDAARPARIGRKLLDADVPSEAKAALRRVEELADEAGGRLTAVAKVADDTGVLASADRVVAAVDDQVAKLREVPFGDSHAIADRIEKQIAPFRERFASVPGVANDTAPTLRFSEVWGLRKSLDDFVYKEGRSGGPAKEALEEMRDAFRKELDDTMAAAAETSGADPGLLKAWKQASEDYSDFALTKESLEGLVQKQGKNRAFSLTDSNTSNAMGLLMGVLSGSPITGLVGAAATGAAHKLIRERGAGVLAKIADRTGGVAGKMELAGKAAALLESPKVLSTPAAINLSEAFERYSTQVTQAQSDPAGFAKRLAGATADLELRYPEVAAQVQQTMVADAAYLDSLHPSPASRINNTITPNAVKPGLYSFNQKQAFIDAATALDNPLGVFEDIARGELPLTKIEALKARRPLLWGEMRTTVIKYTTQREEELPFSRRMLLGTAFDFPSDWSLLHVGEIQAAMAPPGPKSPNDPTAAPSKVNTDPGAQIEPGSF